MLWLGVLPVSVSEWYGVPPLEKMLQVVRLREAMDRYDRQWHQMEAAMVERRAIHVRAR